MKLLAVHEVETTRTNKIRVATDQSGKFFLTFPEFLPNFSWLLLLFLVFPDHVATLEKSTFLRRKTHNVLPFDVLDVIGMKASCLRASEIHEAVNLLARSGVVNWRVDCNQLVVVWETRHSAFAVVFGWYLLHDSSSIQTKNLKKYYKFN